MGDFILFINTSIDKLKLEEEIAQSFEIDRAYDEMEVNEMIMKFYDDYCTLRRDMISEGIMKREGTTYWRKK